jgi:hypothetical protein
MGCDMTTLHKFIEEYRIEVEMMKVSERPDRVKFSEGAQHWAIIMRKGGPQGRAIMLWYSQGSAHKERPTAADILESLYADTQEFASYERTGWSYSFKECCNGLGLDADSRKAYAMWEACKEEYEKMKWLLGDSLYRFYDYVMTEHLNEER